MARYIDADELEKAIDDAQTSLQTNNDKTWEINKPYFKGLAWARALVIEQPTADVVEVPCRCLECRFNVSNMEKDGFDITDYSGEDIVCSYFMTDGMLPTDYCSYGERRTDDELSL